MTSCNNHPKDLMGEKDMMVVAEKISDLHYETLADLFGFLAGKIWWDSRKDKDEGRIKLSRALVGAVEGLNKASRDIKAAYEISKPFMDKQTNEPPK